MQPETHVVKIKHLKYMFLTLVIGLMMIRVTSVYPASNVILVTTQIDKWESDGKCSLREAIASANADSAINQDCSTGQGIDEILVPAGVYTLNKILSLSENQTGDLDISSSMIIRNQSNLGLVKITIVDSSNERILHVQGPISVTLSGIELIGGNANSGEDKNGGGIKVDSEEASLFLNQVVITGNQASIDGGGIYLTGGDLTLRKSKISGNSAQQGSAIYNNGGTVNILDGSIIEANFHPTKKPRAYYANNGTLLMVNASVRNNIGAGLGIQNGGLVNIKQSVLNDNDGVGISMSSGNLQLENVTFSQNLGWALDLSNGVMANANNVTFGTASETIRVQSTSVVTFANSIVFGDCSINAGSIFTDGNNLATITAKTLCGLTDTDDLVTNNLDSEILPLNDNGGLTLTMALTTNSKAINSGNSTICSTVDQRGRLRNKDNCDIGAYEKNSSEPPITPPPPVLDKRVYLPVMMKFYSVCPTEELEINSSGIKPPSPINNPEHRLQQLCSGIGLQGSYDSSYATDGNDYDYYMFDKQSASSKVVITLSGAGLQENDQVAIKEYTIEAPNIASDTVRENGEFQIICPSNNCRSLEANRYYIRVYLVPNSGTYTLVVSEIP